jgi:excisionase family DNA binding protein
MEDNDITVTQAAALLGVTRPAVLQLITRGVLTSRRLGHQHVLSRADVLAYQASRAGQEKRGPAPGTPRTDRGNALAA